MGCSSPANKIDARWWYFATTTADLPDSESLHSGSDVDRIGDGAPLRLEAALDIAADDQPVVALPQHHQRGAETVDRLISERHHAVIGAVINVHVITGELEAPVHRHGIVITADVVDAIVQL